MITNIKVGDEVYWTDPDELSSGVYKVAHIFTESGSVDTEDDMLLITNDAGSEAEVFASELS